LAAALHEAAQFLHSAFHLVFAHLAIGVLVHSFEATFDLGLLGLDELGHVEGAIGIFVHAGEGFFWIHAHHSGTSLRRASFRALAARWAFSFGLVSTAFWGTTKSAAATLAATCSSTIGHAITETVCDLTELGFVNGAVSIGIEFGETI